MDQREPAEQVELPDEPQPDDSRYRWLAHELHDGLLQWIVSARMQVEAGLAKVEAEAAGNKNFLRALGHLEKALAEGRSLIGYLDDQAMGDDDVETALARRLQSIEPESLERGQILRFQKPRPPWPRLSKQKAWSLLRLLQQAVQNAIQHAGPGTVTVTLGWSPENTRATGTATETSRTLWAKVADDGLGFDTSAAPIRGHYGMQSLRQRARMCGARLTIDSSPGNGTQVVVEIPLSETELE